MKIELAKYQRLVYMAIILVSLGVIFSTAMKDALGGLGTVFIAIGGLFFIAGMNEKRKINKRNKNK